MAGFNVYNPRVVEALEARGFSATRHEWHTDGVEWERHEEARRTGWRVLPPAGMARRQAKPLVTEAMAAAAAWRREVAR